MRFVFVPPAGPTGPTDESPADLLTLPWREPLTDWDDERLVEVPTRGLHRHVVRFVEQDGGVFACKELPERLARREYRLLRRVAQLHIPTVQVVGVVVERPDGQDAVLVTRFLEYSSSYRALFANPRGRHPTDRLLDAQVELLVRLHLAGFMWGDCSLSNTLFRLDAGALAAHLVDAETGELHETLSDGQRGYDIETARHNVGGELLDLAAAGLLPPGIDPVTIIDDLDRRYRALWDELTREEVFTPGEQRYRVTEKVRRLHDLGFDIDEIELVEAGAGNRLRLRTRVAEPGHHRRRLRAHTGLDVGENQARRLLDDIQGYRAHLERVLRRPMSESVAATRWLDEVYRPVVEAISPRLRGKLDEAEVFHEVLEHRWFLSEAAGRDVGTGAATRDYLATVLPAVPDDLVSDNPGQHSPEAL
ncbi:MAG: DUF4032 domain-containing protein [Pseudonocardia sp.]